MKRLKQSRIGKALYRASRTSLGAPLRLIANAVQAEVLKPRHYARENIQHNKQQIRTLEAFERKISGPK